MTPKQRHLCLAAVLVLLAMLTPSVPLAVIAAALVLGNVACAAHEEAEERW